MKKKILILTILLLFTFIPTADALVSVKERVAPNYGINKNLNLSEEDRQKNTDDIPYVNVDEKLYDFAEVLTEAEKSTLATKLKAFESKTQMDIVAVVTDANNYRTAKDYGMDFYDYNDFGLNYSNYSGILFLIDLNNRDAYIVTDGNATLYYDDVRIELMLDAIFEYMPSANYASAIDAFVTSAIYYYDEGVPDSNKNYTVDEDGNIIKKYTIPIMPALVFSGIITGIVIAIFVGRNKMVKKETRAGEYLAKNSINYTAKEDTFVSTNTSVIKISSDTSSGGGSGSSTSRGSSGRSHGGGGRSF